MIWDNQKKKRIYVLKKSAIYEKILKFFHNRGILSTDTSNGVGHAHSFIMFVKEVT